MLKYIGIRGLNQKHYHEDYM